MNFISRQQSPPVTVARLHAHLFIICFFLTLFLYLMGGATNPFVSLYLVPIAVSAAASSVRFTAALTACCLLAYTLLIFYYQPLQMLSPAGEMVLQSDHHQMHMMASDQTVSGNAPNMHVIGMWLNFGISALLITYFVVRMAKMLRERDTELSTIRENRLRDEQLLTIATLAAGTVHELGTPLATMSILTEDLKKESAKYPELAADANLLAEQIVRCKTILQNLSRAAEQPVDQLQRVAISDYLNSVITHWQLLKPGIPLKNNVKTVEVFIGSDSTLEQALINLLNNAAEASPQGIELSVLENKNTNTVTIGIHDHGVGVNLDAEKLGKPFMSTRGQGRGLGLFLSNAAIERLGGQVTLEAHPDGGTETRVTLPCIP